jgi:hypothetical protein
MEIETTGPRMGLLHRVIALGLAAATTSFIAASVAVVFTGSGPAVVPALAGIARIPLRALFGG